MFTRDALEESEEYRFQVKSKDFFMFNPLPHMPILGCPISAANRDTMLKY